MEAMTWEEVAELYDECHGGVRRARTLPMETVFDYVAEQKHLVELQEDGTLVRKVKEQS